MSKATSPDSSRPLVVVCVAFFAAGMAGAAIGPLIPDLARQTGASEIAVGGALSALFARSPAARCSGRAASGG